MDKDNNIPPGCPLEKKIEDAVNIIENYGSIDGGHHKQWCLDQIARILLGEKYDAWIEEMLGEYNEEDEEYEYCEWDKGVAP